MIFLFFFLWQCLDFSASVDIPTQIHIAFAGRNGQNDSNGMAISWNTKGKTPTSTVQFGVKSGLYARKSMGSSDSYYESFNHHVVLENLRPNTEYFYRVGDETFGWSQEYSFRSAPSVENLRSNFSFYVFGDLGKVNGESSEKYIKANLENIHFVWHAGDMSYADDSETYPGCEHSFCYDKVWDDYLLDTEEWASQIPYMVIPGNHEADCHDSYCATNETLRAHFTNFTAYNHRFRMPSPESGGVLNMWYSFNYGNVHFISVNTETDFANAPEETSYTYPCGGFGDPLTWLEQDLKDATANRQLRPWILAIGHHFIYNGIHVDTSIQTAVEDLFYRYGVDVFFVGHQHSYER